LLVVKLKWSHLKLYVDTITCKICITNDHGYVPFVVFTIRSYLHSWHGLQQDQHVRRQRVSLVERELLTTPMQLSVKLASRCSIISFLCSVFLDHCLSLCPFILAILLSVFFDLRLLVTLLVYLNVSYVYLYFTNTYHFMLVIAAVVVVIVLDTILCDKICQWLATGRRFSSGKMEDINLIRVNKMSVW
jgi:hypothetical protein